MWNLRFDTKIDFGPCTVELKERSKDALLYYNGKKWILKDVIEVCAVRYDVLMRTYNEETRESKVYTFYFLDFDSPEEIVDLDHHEAFELVGTIEIDHGFIKAIRESCD